jgi:hypothetical protein
MLPLQQIQLDQIRQATSVHLPTQIGLPITQVNTTAVTDQTVTGAESSALATKNNPTPLCLLGLPEPAQRTFLFFLLPTLLRLPSVQHLSPPASLTPLSTSAVLQLLELDSQRGSFLATRKHQNTPLPSSSGLSTID